MPHLLKEPSLVCSPSTSIPLTQAVLKAQASIFRSFERLLELELSGLTEDSRYELTFSRLVKPDPFRLFNVESGPDVPLMLGTDQRDYLAPLLGERLADLPAGAKILDVGSGDGQTTAHALADRREPLTFIPVDPAQGALDRYKDLIASTYPHIAVARTLAVGIDEMVGAAPDSAWALGEPLDMIIAIHVLYFTDDLAGFLRFAHDRLPPGGKIVIAFAEHGGRYSGRLAYDYWKQYPAPPGVQHHAPGHAIDDFFGILDGDAGRAVCEAALREQLGDDLFGVTELIRQPTRIFGHDIGDLIAAGLITGLAAKDDEQLRHQIHYVSDRLQNEPETFDLRLVLNGPRSRMLSIAQPQIFLELQKI